MNENNANFTPEAPNFRTLVRMSFQGLTNFPYIEEDFDALTNYELLSKVVEYLNQVISNNNEQNTLMTGLYNAYVSLQDYVNDYFDNLDVQEEINNKLDEMSKSGELTTLISNYIDPYITAQNQEISSFKNEVNATINQQNNKINALEEGSPLVASSVEGMTDTTRIYVNTSNGYWYYYDGDSWEQGGVYQATQIQDNSVDLESLVENINNSINCEIISTDELINGKYISNGGSVGTSTNYSMSDFIFLNVGDRIVYTSGGSQSNCLLAQYYRYREGDKYFAIINGEGSSVTSKDIDYTAVTSGLYVVSGRTSNMTDIKIYRKNLIKNVINDIKLDSINNIIPIDEDNIQSNKYVEYTGQVRNFNEYNDEFWVSNFIEIKPNSKIKLLTTAKQLPENTTTNVGIAIYDGAKSYLTGYKYIEGSNYVEMDIPATAKYVNFTITAAMKKTGYYLYYTKLDQTIETTTSEPELYRSLLKVGAIGDSLASGECAYKLGGVDRLVDIYKHSWPQYMARMSGNTYINFSKGGMNTRTWLTSEKGYPLASQTENICDAYIIGLGVNDANNLGLSYLGTSSDIDTSDYTNNGDTFYGNYAGIIQRMQVLQPKAKFFLLTMPRTTTLYQTFNEAIRDIATILNNCYVIDLEEHASEFGTGSFDALNARNGHFNAIAYNNIAIQISKLISKYMYENYTEFSQVEFIGTDYEW